MGDETNRRFVPEGVEYFELKQFQSGGLSREFESVFVPIAGRAHHFTKAGGVEMWLRFVFLRWFIIREFLHEQKIGAFWIFDSDTLIAGDLGARQGQFSGLDATEQCRGCCLNGWVSARSVVDGYCQAMVDLFRRPDYLAAQRERLEEQAGLAFNEMDAWQTHRDEGGLKTRALGEPSGGEAFDDALAMTAGWQVAATRVRGRIPVKRLLADQRGGFWGFPVGMENPVRLVTLNLSWMPDYIFHRLARGCAPAGLWGYDSRKCFEVDFTEPLIIRLARLSNEKLWKLRSRWGNRGMSWRS